ncbi:MAG: MFS transporter [Clostridia bacterium]|nr:MFS transporter [Clostridia bacterium]MBQ7086344.1 MFS transporter [Clostridia bacterium]
MKKNKLMAYFCVIVLFYLAANFAHPVTPTLIVERNLDSSMFGVALAAMMFVNFLFSPLWGKLCMYIPTKRIMLICGIGYAVGQAIFGMATTEIMVVGGRMFAGIFTGGMFTAFSNYVVNTSPDQNERGQNLTILVTIQNVASAVGYFIGGMMGVISVEFAFICQIVCLVIAGVLFFLCCEDDTKYKHKPEKALTLKDANPFAAFLAAKSFMTPMLFLIFAVVAVAGIGQNSFEQCFNYYIKDQFNMSSVYNGIFKAVIAVASLVANATLCLWMQKKTDTNKSFLPLMAVQTVFLAFVLVNSSIASFAVCDVMFFALNAVRMPLLQNMVAMRTTPENSNQVMGFYQAMNSLGSIFGALFAGLIYDMNPMLPFILAAAAYGISVLIGGVYVGKYKKNKA